MYQKIKSVYAGHLFGSVEGAIHWTLFHRKDTKDAKQLNIKLGGLGGSN
jgi:hypothetical protein